MTNKEKLDIFGTIDDMALLGPGESLIYYTTPRSIAADCGSRRIRPLRNAAWNLFLEGKVLLTQRRTLRAPTEGESPFGRWYWWEYIATGTQHPRRAPRFTGCYKHDYLAPPPKHRDNQRDWERRETEEKHQDA